MVREGPWHPLLARVNYAAARGRLPPMAEMTLNARLAALMKLREELIDATYKALMDQGEASVMASVGKQIRPATRVFFQHFLMQVDVQHLKAYLQNLPPDWRKNTEVILTLPAPLGGSVTSDEPNWRLKTMAPWPWILPNDGQWEGWLNKYSRLTGQSFAPPYLYEPPSRLWEVVTGVGILTGLGALVALGRRWL